MLELAVLAGAAACRAVLPPPRCVRSPAVRCWPASRWVRRRRSLRDCSRPHCCRSISSKLAGQINAEAEERGRRPEAGDRARPRQPLAGLALPWARLSRRRHHASRGARPRWPTPAGRDGGLGDHGPRPRTDRARRRAGGARRARAGRRRVGRAHRAWLPGACAGPARTSRGQPDPRPRVATCVRAVSWMPSARSRWRSYPGRPTPRWPRSRRATPSRRARWRSTRSLARARVVDRGRWRSRFEPSR